MWEQKNQMLGTTVPPSCGVNQDLIVVEYEYLQDEYIWTTQYPMAPTHDNMMVMVAIATTTN